MDIWEIKFTNVNQCLNVVYSTITSIMEIILKQKKPEKSYFNFNNIQLKKQ